MGVVLVLVEWGLGLRESLDVGINGGLGMLYCMDNLIVSLPSG